VVDPAKLVEAFEELYAAVVAALIDEPAEIPARVRVLALPSERDIERLLGRYSAGGYRISRSSGEATILVAADQVESLPQVVAHELAHHLSRYAFPHQEPWFAEGLAQFVESVAKVGRDGRRWAGGEPMIGVVAESINNLVPVTYLFGLRPGDVVNLPAFYATSWVVYRFLWNERGPQFTEYRRRLSAGESPDDAWVRAFPEWDPRSGTLNRMDGHIEHHRRHSKGLPWEVKMGQVDRSFTTAPASRALLHMVLLEYQLNRTPRLLQTSLRCRVAAEVLREEPLHPLALLELARVDGKPALAAMRAAVASHPEDGRAWYLLGHEAQDPVERETALRKAVSLWTDGALAHAELGSHLASTGRPNEALPFAERAVELAPWNSNVIASLAEVAMALGKCKEALILQARAVDVGEAGEAPELLDDKAAAEQAALRARFTAYRARCQADHAALAAGN
jgi:tetratricopeptide (TPR) repeat protein